MAMAFRVLRLGPYPLPTPYGYARHCNGPVRVSLYIAQELISTAPSTPASFRSRCLRTAGGSRRPLNARSFSSSSGVDGTNNTTIKGQGDNSRDEQQPELLYEGAFASLTLKLKRVSLTSAVIGIVGLPALSFFYGAAGSVPASGQIAVIATAGITAVGSTALLGYCFSPYVHTLERLPHRPISSESDDGNNDATTDDAEGGSRNIVRATTRDILSMRVETIFDPATDVSPPPAGNSRPFCNFMVKGMPMYVHPELVHDDKLRVQLVGREPQQENAEAKNKHKTDDDEFL